MTGNWNLRKGLGGKSSYMMAPKLMLLRLTLVSCVFVISYWFFWLLPLHSCIFWVFGTFWWSQFSILKEQKSASGHSIIRYQEVVVAVEGERNEVPNLRAWSSVFYNRHFQRGSLKKYYPHLIETHRNSHSRLAIFFTCFTCEKVWQHAFWVSIQLRK